MKKSDISAKLRELHPKLGLDEAKIIVNLLIDSMSEVLIAKKRIEIRGFGTFCTRLTNKKLISNPRDRTIVSGPTAYTTVYFRPGKELEFRVKNTLANSIK